MFASKNRPNQGASIANDGFAQCLNRNKRTRPATVVNKDDFTPSNQVNINEFQKRQEGLRFTKTTSENVGCTDKSRFCNTLLTKKLRRIRNPSEDISTQQAQRVPAKSGEQVAAQSGQRLLSKSGIHIPAQSGQHILAQSGQCNSAQSQPQEHSPVRSRQHTSNSGQNTPDQSRQLTAQSRQHIPSVQSEPREGTPALSHPNPSIVNASSTAANNNGNWHIGSEHSDGRIRVEVIKKVLEPSNQCSSKIRQIMYERLDPTGYNWKSVSKVTQDIYFEEFKKYFVWRQSDPIIYKGWLANARKKYSELVSNAHSRWENHQPPDNRIGSDVYSSWIEFWETPECQHKSEIQKNNRRGGVDGHFSTHTSGSASHRTVAARMAVSMKREPTVDELFLKVHLRRPKKKKNMNGGYDDDEDNNENSNGERIWIDKKSQQIYETFEKLCEQQEKAGLPIDKNALFLEAVGGFDAKKRVYGLGSSQNLFYRTEIIPCTTSFVDEENQMLKQEIKEMNDRMKAMENQLSMILEATSRRLQSPTTDLVSENDDNE